MADPTMPDPDPRAELFHWGRDEELDAPVFLYEIDYNDGACVYWVIALDPLHAAEVLRDAMLDENFDDPDEWTDGKYTARGVGGLEAASLKYHGAYGEPDVAFVTEFNRDPSPRVMACSEWTP